MTYNRIMNTPYERQYVTYPWCFYDGVFNDEELLIINRFMDGIKMSEASTTGESSFGKVYDPNDRPRVSKTHFENPSPENMWVFHKLNAAIESLNEEFYNFDLNGYPAIQFTEYHANVSGKYDFHPDMMLGKLPDEAKSTRKLSVVVMLNEPGVDFDGGQFQFNLGLESSPVDVEMKKGRLIVFPSFLIHRVAPVTRGVRRSMVAWVEGPKFR